MTKKVRIENADTSDCRVVVQVWDKGHNGEPDVMTGDDVYLTAMTGDDVYLTSTRYAVVKEA